MMLNTFDHSGKSEVSVFGQYYPTKKEVIFTILDLGIGIPNHIRKKYSPETDENLKIDAYCLKRSTEEGFTGSTPDKNSGVGLFELKQFIKQTHNNLRIISGNGYFELINGKECLSNLDYPFKGTIVDFQLFLKEPIPEFKQDLNKGLLF